jgi:hypothetical protein
MEEFSSIFTSYYVRTILLDFKGMLFTVQDFTDPVELLASTLLHFISKYLLEDGEILKVRLRGKRFGITNKTHLTVFESEHALINGIKPAAPVQAAQLVEEDDDEDEDSFYSFNEDDEDSYVDGGMNLTNWMMPAEYDPSSFKMPSAPEPPKYDNFNVRAGVLVIKCGTLEQTVKIKQFLLGKTTTSTDSVKVFCRFRTMNHLIGVYKESVLAEMDKEAKLWI